MSTRFSEMTRVYPSDVKGQKCQKCGSQGRLHKLGERVVCSRHFWEYQREALEQTPGRSYSGSAVEMVQLPLKGGHRITDQIMAEVVEGRNLRRERLAAPKPL